MSSWIYIIAVIIFAIVSNRSKLGKPKGGPSPRGGMPTFGGDDREPARSPRRSGQSGSPEGRASGFPQPSQRHGRPEPHQSAEPPVPRRDDGSGRPERPGPTLWTERAEDSASGGAEGLPFEPDGSGEDDVAARTAQMQREFERLQAAFDGTAGKARPGAPVPGDAPAAAGADAAEPAAARSGLAGDRASLRSGVIWAEILGPPRSRSPHSTRRQR
ncbi:hypothetical protein [Paenibacillus tengchongensis]|uniref:hypothetical protein n=1 Tax=Paenibacillus tengchongensis TaxID=2608684 RepID=UPI00124D6CCC|nr:hypothetical protein [Paenibacillus tengchongensis]